MVFCNSKNFFVKAVLVSLLAIAVCFGCSPKEDQVKEQEVELPQIEGLDLLSLASVQISDWQEEETIFISKAEDMLKYMGDRAELYFAYGFVRLAVKKYRNKKSLPMLVEVYEFDSSENTYGMYSFDTMGEKLDIGQDSVYGHGLLKFWKDKILVKVIAEEEYQELQEDILEFGREIDSRILTTGSKPELLSLVLEDKLVPDSLHFFHSNICLNNIYYIPASTALGLSEQTNAITAQYMLGGNQPTRLLLIEYPNESAARTAFEKFSALYFQGESISADQRINIVRMADEEYNSITLTQNFVIPIFEAQNSDLCKKLLAATLAKIELYYKSTD